MNPRSRYGALAVGTLGVSGIAAVLAVVAVALQEALGVAASALCSAVFLVPGLYFLGFARRLRARDVALAHVAQFVAGREATRLQDLAEELHVSPADAEKILRTALREGHVRGRFDGPDRFVAEGVRPEPAEGDR